MNSERSRSWFLTINKGAESFSTFKNNLIDCEFYSYILHNKDVDTLDHFHVLLKYKNARSFESIRNKFVGSHVEIVKDINATCQYLIHLNEDCSKYKYSSSDIVTNNLDKLNILLNSKSCEIFDFNQIKNYYEEGCCTYLDFVNRFGKNIRLYVSMIDRYLNERSKLEHLKNDIESNLKLLQECYNELNSIKLECLQMCQLTKVYEENLEKLNKRDLELKLLLEKVNLF